MIHLSASVAFCEASKLHLRDVVVRARTKIIKLGAAFVEQTRLSM